MTRGVRLLMQLFAVLALACSAPPEKRIVGTWAEVGGTEQMEFFADGTFNVVIDGRSMGGTYSLPAEGRLRLDVRGSGAFAGPVVLSYTLDRKSMTLTDPAGNVATFTRRD